MNLTVVTPPDEPAVSLDQALQYLRIDSVDADEEAFVLALLNGVERQAEASTGRAFVRQTLRVVAQPEAGIGAPGVLSLPRTPVIELQSATDSDGNPLGPSGFALSLDGERVLFSRRFSREISLTYVAGYYDPGEEAPGKVPASVQAGLLKALATLYENREDVALSAMVSELPQTAELFFDSVRRRLL